MRRSVWRRIGGAAAALCLRADDQVTVRHARNWQPGASEGWCAIKVRVDGEAEFALRAETLTIRTNTGEPARDIGSECSTPLPRNVENFRFKGVDGRGDVRLLEQPSSRNGWMAVVRIRDSKGGSEDYHFRLEWGRGSSFTEDRSGNNRGSGNRSGGGWSSGGNSSSDLARMRTRELRREIESLWQSIHNNRRPSQDTVDDYIDRIRLDRWSLDQVQRDIERQR